MGNIISGSPLFERAKQSPFTTVDVQQPEWSPKPGILEQATLSLQDFTKWMEDEAKTPGGGLSSLIIQRIEHRRSRRKPFHHQYIVLYIKHNGEEVVIRLDRMGKLNKIWGTWWQPLATSGTAKDTVRIIHRKDPSAKTVIEDFSGSTVMNEYRLPITSGLDPALVMQYQREATLALQEQLLPIFYSLPNPPEIPPVLIDHMNTHHGYTSPLGYYDSTIDPRITYLIASAVRSSEARGFSRLPYGPYLQYLTDRQRIYKGTLRRRLGNASALIFWDEWRLDRVWDFIYLPLEEARRVEEIVHQVRSQLDLHVHKLSSPPHLQHDPLATLPATVHDGFRPASLQGIGNHLREMQREWPHYSLATTNCILFSQSLFAGPRLWDFYVPGAMPPKLTFSTLRRWVTLGRLLLTLLELIGGMLGVILCLRALGDFDMVTISALSVGIASFSFQSLFHSRPVLPLTLGSMLALFFLVAVRLPFDEVLWLLGAFPLGVVTTSILVHAWSALHKRKLRLLGLMVNEEESHPLSGSEDGSGKGVSSLIPHLQEMVMVPFIPRGSRDQLRPTNPFLSAPNTGHATSSERHVAFYCQVFSQWLNYLLVIGVVIYAGSLFFGTYRFSHEWTKTYVLVGGSVFDVLVVVQMLILPAIIHRARRARYDHELKLWRARREVNPPKRFFEDDGSRTETLPATAAGSSSSLPQQNPPTYRPLDLDLDPPFSISDAQLTGTTLVSVDGTDISSSSSSRGDSLYKEAMV